MKWKNTLISSAIVVGVIGSATTVFAATQSNQTPANSVQSAPAQMGHGRHRHGHLSFGQVTGAADVLGVTQATLKADLQSGKSVAQIAKSKGISETTLIAKLKTNFKTNLDKAVKNGKLTSAQETRMLSNFNSHAKQFVEHIGGFAGHPGGWHGARGRAGSIMAGVPQVLGISQSTLRSDLQSGKSIAQIAKNKGMTETTLIAKLKANFKTNLDKAVKNGKLTSSQETHILSNFATHAKQFVEHKGCAGPSGSPTKGSVNGSTSASASGAPA